MTADKSFDWPGLLGAGFFLSIPFLLAGAIFEVRWMVFVGCLLMVPLFLGIILGFSVLAAEKAKDGAECLFGKGPISNAVFWIVLALIASMILFAGSAEYAGPRFWGSID